MKHPENFALLSIVLLVLIVHFIVMFRADDLIYDEEAYIGEANYVLHGWDLDPFYYQLGVEKYDSGTTEKYLENGYKHHMPLSKLFLATGVGIFGDNSVGWRIMPVLFGTASIFLFYLICKRLTARKWLPLVATFIFAFENICFILSSLALLEVFMFTFVLLAFLLYLDKRYVLAGIAVALATLCKMSGSFAGGVIILHWIITERKVTWNAVKFVGVSLMAFFALMPLLDFIAVRQLLYPWDRVYYMFDVHNDPFLAQAPDQYRKVIIFLFPWEWLVSRQPLDVGPDGSYHIDISWTLWVLAIPSMGYVLYETIRHRWNSLCLFTLLWFVCSYFPWFVVYWVFDRVSYMIYFYPAAGAICLALGYAVYQILSIASKQSNPLLRWSIRFPVVSLMMAHFVIFWIMVPIFL